VKWFAWTSSDGAEWPVDRIRQWILDEHPDATSDDEIEVRRLSYLNRAVLYVVDAAAIEEAP
jgi:hypothetical protein